VKSPALAFYQAEKQSRGSVEEAFRTSLFATPYGPSFVAGFAAGREANVTDQSAAELSVEESKPWSLSAEFGVGTAIDSVPNHDAPQLQMSLSGGWEGPGELQMGVYAGYGYSSDSAATVHRVGGGLELLWGGEFGAFRLAPRVRFGPQAVFVNADFGVRGEELRADPLGLRGEGALSFGYVLGSVAMHATAGLGADFTTTARSEEANVESLYLTPFLGVGVTY
jgi:hypothetical protein